MTGLFVLVGALAVTVVIAVLKAHRDGRFTAVEHTGVVDDDVERLDAERLGQPLGERATLVQFSSAFCAPCRATRVVLGQAAEAVDGVTAIDIDAEAHLDLVRELGIVRTPTVLVLDAQGRVLRRASGVPRREQVLAAIAAASQ
ncbi:thioredoxin [Aeromicrobium phragmitis]|uniref:Thioredoxin n=1 Tax=Aeromicrobium phragmitis TaxID=2478914 RepID=A0A3L8PI55_9ACTN|nr:thioredoxin family protein [Aeromicrobium phragmitis]RLV54911.1 thioredoxin [Aeromicrobium phragmitis]